MDKLRSWIFGGQNAKKDTANEKEGEGQNFKKLPLTSTIPESALAVEPDPVVVEFFRDFPELYRQKAIERFSKREGIQRWDFFRSLAMTEEMNNAKRGIFLEDRREFEELQRQKHQIEWENEQAEKRRLFYERDIPEWERQLLRVIPLQSWDSMTDKLRQSGALAIAGILFALSGLTYRRSSPKLTWKVASVMFGSLGSAGCCEVAAVHRLLDWEPFDRSVDDREFIAKAKDDFKETYEVLRLYFEQSSRP